MLTIRNNEQANLNYHLLYMLEKEMETAQNKDNYVVPIIDLKRAIRKYNKLQMDRIKRYDVGNKTYYIDFETKKEKYIFNNVFSKHDILDYKMDNWQYIDSLYDCSGQWFTTNINIITIPEENKTIVIESLSMDV